MEKGNYYPCRKTGAGWSNVFDYMMVHAAEITITCHSIWIGTLFRESSPATNDWARQVIYE